MTQAALPFLRAQGHGHILQVSSIGGICAFTNVGLYHASKWALEGFSDTLSQEVAPFGIKVTLIEPGGFSTDWSGSSAKRARQMPEYDAMREQRAAQSSGMKRGDPAASSAAILKLVDAENPPLRLFLGAYPTQLAPKVYAERLKTWEEWKDVSVAADGS